MVICSTSLSVWRRRLSTRTISGPPCQHAALNALHDGVGETAGGFLVLLQDSRRLRTDIPDPQDAKADHEDGHDEREDLDLQVAPHTPTMDSWTPHPLSPAPVMPAARAADTTGTHTATTPLVRGHWPSALAESCLIYYSTVLPPTASSWGERRRTADLRRDLPGERLQKGHEIRALCGGQVERPALGGQPGVGVPPCT